MYRNKYLDFNKPITLYNIFDKIGAPGSELETAIIGGLYNIKYLDGCYVEEQIILKNLNNINTKLRYDFGLVFKNSNDIQIRIEANGSQHFWKPFDISINDFKEYQFNFYQKQISSKIPIININMCVKDNTFKNTLFKRKSYVELIESNLLEQVINEAKSFNKNINIIICNDLIIQPTKCGILEVDKYITDMIFKPDYKLTF